MIVLAIQDNPQEMALLRDALSNFTKVPILVEHADRLSVALSCLAVRRFDAILLDLNLSDSQGLDTLARVQARASEVPVVIMTGLDDEPLAIEGIRAGAQDYIVKGQYDGGVVSRVLRAAIERTRRVTDLETRVAEREQAERALRLSEQRYASLLNSVGGIVWEADPATFCFTFVSIHAEHILGYPVQQWLNDPSFWLDHILPEDRERSVAYCVEQTKLGLPHNFEYRMLAANGRTVWIRDMVSVVVEEGCPVKVRGIMVDVTEQKREHEKLVQLQCAVDRGTEGVAILNTDGLYTYMNPSHAALYGYEVEELIGKTWKKLYGSEQQDMLEQAHFPFLQQVGYWRGELVGRKKTGELLDIEIALQQFSRGEGHTPDMICTFRDITESKRVTRQEWQRFRLLQEHQAGLLELTQSKAIISGDLPQAFQAITEMASRVLAVERASIWLFQEDHAAILLQDLYEASTRQHSAGTVLQADQFPSYFQALEREEHALAAYDAHSDPRTCEFSSTYCAPLGIGAMLDVPIRHNGKVVGVFCHEHLGTCRIWTADEMTVAGSFAMMVTLAMEAMERGETEKALRQAKERAEKASAAKK